MAFIDYVSYDDATDDLKKLYEAYGGENRTPANILRIAGLNPKAMQAHVDLYRSIMFQKSPLSRAQREMIATVVSSINKCHYWIEHHWAALRSLKKLGERVCDDSLKAELTTDWRSADISDFDKQILDYTEKTTLNAHTITQEYIDDKKANGFDDLMLHDIVQVVSYFNYVNRMADALGIELEK